MNEAVRKKRDSQLKNFPIVFMAANIQIKKLAGIACGRGVDRFVEKNVKKWNKVEIYL